MEYSEHERREQLFKQDMTIALVCLRLGSARLQPCHLPHFPQRKPTEYPFSSGAANSAFASAPVASLLSTGGYFVRVSQGAVPQERAGVVQAIRLLGGSPDEVLSGISLIDAAAEQGDPEALERKALFEAVGCARQQSWDRALDCLALAAEGGSRRAQDQLRILARSDDEEPDWRALRSAISIADLIQVPPKRIFSEVPRLRAIEGFATPAECLWLVECARDRLRPATVIIESGSQTMKAGRTNRAIEFQLADMDLVVEVVRARISTATRLPLPLFETSQVLHYAPGQEFRVHHDYFDPDNPGHAEHLKGGQRIATFLVYLNDAYTRGETAFPRAQLSFRGNVGDALFISNVERSGRPDPMTLHAGTPPGSGEKWIFSQWIRDRVPTAAPQAH